MKKVYCTSVDYKTKAEKDCDYTLKEANERIKTYNKGYAMTIVKGMIAGSITLTDAINIEIDYHNRCIENAKELGFGNSVRFGMHCIKILKALPPQQPETGQETQTFTNNFDNIKPTEIYNHFKAGLVEKGYLTEQELNEYLKAAFELKTKPKTLFKLKHTPTKQKIYTVFYIYYKDVSGKKHEQQTRYAELLGNYFEGYNTEIIKTNWARDYKTKR